MRLSELKAATKVLTAFDWGSEDFNEEACASVIEELKKSGVEVEYDMREAVIRRTTDEEKARFASLDVRRGWVVTLSNGAVMFTRTRRHMEPTIKFLRTQGYTIKEAA